MPDRITNWIQALSGLLLAPILHLYATKADKEDLRLKADKAVVDEMSKSLNRMDEKLDLLVVNLIEKKVTK